MSGGKKQKQTVLTSMREVVFGMEDSLVSTLGTITGIAIGTGDAYVTMLSGVVLIFVEALSMAAGSYLSSKAAQQALNVQEQQDVSRLLQFRVKEGEKTLQDILRKKGINSSDVHDILDIFTRERKLFVKEFRKRQKVAESDPEWSAVVMGFFYLFGGIFPLAPYFFLPVSTALILSIGMTVVVLGILGAWKGKMVHISVKASMFEMITISLLATGVGFIIGRLFSYYFGIYV